MKLVRVQMIGQRDSLQTGNFYNLDPDLAEQLIIEGKAIEIKPTGPTEFKPAGPSEIKLEAKPKKKVHREPMASES
jgi:hypothetical protein